MRTFPGTHFQRHPLRSSLLARSPSRSLCHGMPALTLNPFYTPQSTIYLLINESFRIHKPSHAYLYQPL